MKKKYTKRIVDDIIKEKLSNGSSIVIEGPRCSGKTTTATKYSKSTIDLKDKDETRKIAKIEPQKLLEGKKPRLIDNYQEMPILANTPNSYEQLIFTGLKNNITSLEKITMFPMSLYESGESTGEISVLDLFKTPDYDINHAKSNLTLDELTYASCRGGWPESMKNGLKFIEDYINNICEDYMIEIDNVRRNPRKVKEILTSYAKNISIETTKSQILSDIKKNTTMSRKTLDNYLNALSNLLITRDIPAWTPPIRTKGAVKTSPKKQFIDPSIAAILLNLNPKDKIYNLKSFTYVFECLCIRDLTVYTAKRQGQISHYKDRYGLKADCVVHIDNGDYALFDFILGGSKIEQSAKQLLKLQKLVDEKPKFLAVITASDVAYTRDDGVMVIPIGCLR